MPMPTGVARADAPIPPEPREPRRLDAGAACFLIGLLATGDKIPM
jgi:hypothetical protein